MRTFILILEIIAKVKVNFIDILYFHDIRTVLCENRSQVLFLYLTTVKDFDACDIVMVYGSYFYFSKFYSIIIYS